jgi:hypothetical protein
MINGKIFTINTTESASFSVKVSTKNPGGQAVPVNLDEKELHFYVKFNEQDKDEDAFIHKFTGSGITHTNPALGEAEIDLLPSDTVSLLNTNLTHKTYWSLRVVYGSVNKFIQEGVLLITPA